MLIGGIIVMIAVVTAILLFIGSFYTHDLFIGDIVSFNKGDKIEKGKVNYIYEEHIYLTTESNPDSYTMVYKKDII